MTEKEKIRFDGICRAVAERNLQNGDMGIGTYTEKRLHRIIKEFVTEDESCYEVGVGRYVADVYSEGHITEIQTASFKPLAPKIRYYLENTDCKITVICPLLAENMIIRIDPESGEALRKRRSSVHENFCDLIARLYYLRDTVPNERLEFKVMLIRAEEHRYSERMRYRKEGAYVSELFPIELLDSRTFCSYDDFRVLLPPADEFDAKYYSAFIKRKGRDLYSCLNFLCSIGLLCREKQGRKYIYKKI